MSRIAKAAAVAVGTGAVVVSGAGLALADAGAQGAAVGSPGVVSGNVIQVPVHVPVNVCGNTVDIIALLNPAFGNTCANVSGKGKETHGNPGPSHGGYGNGGYGN
ncbi:chaplin [Streptomyces cinerochromogenes]|uniref:chaplin n=1 Tax=Streptomyces cinerochromogenes TaxID=66422 RepID=UPI003694CCFE